MGDNLNLIIKFCSPIFWLQNIPRLGLLMVLSFLLLSCTKDPLHGFLGSQSTNEIESGPWVFYDKDNTISGFGGGQSLNSHWQTNYLEILTWTPSLMEMSSNDLYMNTNGLLVLWNLNEANANEATNANIVDDSGTYIGVLGTGDGAASKSVTGKVNGGIIFEDLGDHINFGNVLDFDRTDTRSFSFWIKRNNLNGINQWIVTKDTNMGVYQGWGIGFSGTEELTVLLINDNTTNFISVRTEAVMDTLNVWQNVVVTYDGSSSASGVKVYVDGALVPTLIDADTLTNSISTTSDFNLGSLGNGTNSLDGVLDEFSIWSRVMTPSEILQNYQRQKGQYGGGQVSEFTSRVFNTTNPEASWLSFAPVQGPYGKPYLSSGTESSDYLEDSFDFTNVVGLWKMDGNLGGIAPGSFITDDSANAFSCTSTGTMSFVEGLKNQAIEFDGATSYISCGNPVGLQLGVNDWTLSAWIYPYDMNNENHIVGKQASSTDKEFSLFISALGVGSSIETASNNAGLGVPRLTQINRWQHLVATYDHDILTLNLYLDGEPLGTGTVPVGAANFAADFEIGRRGYDNQHFSGKIDELIVFNRRLSPTEVLSLYRRDAIDLKYQVRSCSDEACTGVNFVGPGASTTTYFSEESNGGLTPSGFDLSFLPDNQYFQYKVIMETIDSDQSPKLESVEISAE